MICIFAYLMTTQKWRPTYRHSGMYVHAVT